MPIVSRTHAPSTHGRIALANAGPTSRVTSAPMAKLNAIESPT